MAKQQPFVLVYAEDVRQHLRAIEAKYHSLIRDTIRSQLTYVPDRETRNRKPLKRPVEFGAEWELRFGPDNRFRVFYSVNRTERKVEIVAIGTKERNRVRIGGEEIEL